MTSTHGESGPSEPSADQRLDSWKEIATYLKRDERTVRRWEAQQGLPVHRHLHTKRASVYAFRSEIDVWWNNGQARLEHEPSVPPATRRWVTVAVVAGAAVLAVVVGRASGQSARPVWTSRPATGSSSPTSRIRRAGRSRMAPSSTPSRMRWANPALSTWCRATGWSIRWA